MPFDVDKQKWFKTSVNQIYAAYPSSQKDVHYSGGAFVGHIVRPLCQRFVYFYARVLIVYDYSSSGQAIFYKSIARVKGDVSVN